MSSKLTQTAINKCYGGSNRTYKHASISTKTDMTFSIFFPKECEDSSKSPPPIIYYLSGLTCTDQNALTKGGFQRFAAERGVCMVFPDTSPRGANVEGETESWDFGAGAGFYVTATTPKWKNNYDMYSYVSKELPELLKREFPTQLDHSRKSIMGHSMGGHGALIIALKNPGVFASCSAFSPICNPMNCPWGLKAFTGYLGEDKNEWKAWDASELAKTYKGPKLDILADQGSVDDFLIKKQLLPEALIESVKGNREVSLHFRMQIGYDHSYYFITTFAQDHVNFHADILEQKKNKL